jgi:cytochrome c2
MLGLIDAISSSPGPARARPSRAGRRLLAMLAATWLLAGAAWPLPALAASRVKDIADFEGVRTNMLVGYGLVVGLNGTGDSLRNSMFTEESLVAMLERLGVGTRGNRLNAKMLITLVAEPEDAFQRWRAEQAAPARPPSDPLARRGERVFASSPCVMCHVVRGSPASGYSASAPDLTHLASRRTIAAGAAPNEPGWLAGWIVDPQGLKPGAHMPPMLLAPDDLQALLAYLRGLR